MAIPNFKNIVEQVYRSGSYDLTTLEGCGAFTRACAGPVHDADPRIVMLKKSAGRTHVVDSKGRRHAADALLLVENGKGVSIDIVGNSRTPKATPSWTVDKYADGANKGQIAWRYTAADGFVPDYSDEPTPIPDPGEPAPNPGSDLEARVAALELKFARLKAAL